MRICVVVLVGVFVPAATAAAGIFKWVDDQGQVHYSDRPDSTNAQEMNLGPLTTYRAQRVTTAPTGNVDTEAAGPAYTRFVITAPPHDAAIRDNAGNIGVEIDIEPELRQASGHTIVVLVDGQARGRMTSTSATLTNVDRGTHTIEARVVDSNDTQIAQTAPVTVHLQRVSQRPSPRPR